MLLVGLKAISTPIPPPKRGFSSLELCRLKLFCEGLGIFPLEKIVSFEKFYSPPPERGFAGHSVGQKLSIQLFLKVC